MSPLRVAAGDCKGSVSYPMMFDLLRECCPDG